MLACSLFAGCLGVGAFASAAYAGDWMQVACVNPDGSAASSEGWSSFSSGSPGLGSNSGTNCGPGTPMYAILSTQAAASVGQSEDLQYTPPSGSTLVGGSVDVSLSTDGYGYDASGVAAIYTPAFAYNGSNVVTQCAAGLSPCWNGTNDFTGGVELPANRGGDLFIGASCGGNAGEVCDEGGGNGGWATASLYSANLLLNSSDSPTATAFSGTLLDPDAHGTASIAFTATDPGGPGVYKVIVSIDGTVAYDATPNTNGGECASVGTDSASGAWMFDSQQPCLQTESVDVPVDTTAFADGEHELTVQVVDAAQNTSTVLDQTITTANLTTVSSLLPTQAPPSTAGPVYAFVLDKATSALGAKVSRTYNRSALTLSGTLDDEAAVAAPGVAVAVWGSPADGATFSLLSQTTTDGAGRWTLHVPEGSSRVLHVVAGAGAAPTGTASTLSVSETVTPTLSLNIATPGRANLVFSGQLGISPLGTPRPLVFIEVKGPDGWQAVGSPVRVATTGHYRYVYASSPFTVDRRFEFRAVTPAAALWPQTNSHPHSAVVH